MWHESDAGDETLTPLNQIGFMHDDNMYRYAENKPTSFADPLGLFTYASVYACFNLSWSGCWVSAGTCGCDLREPTTAIERPFFVVSVEVAAETCCFSVGQRVANGLLFPTQQPAAMMACVQGWLRTNPNYGARASCSCT